MDYNMMMWYFDEDDDVDVNKLWALVAIIALYTACFSLLFCMKYSIERLRRKDSDIYKIFTSLLHTALDLPSLIFNQI